MRYIFGPVASRRLNLSLGVDLVPPKVCSMDCLYCEVGRTTLKTTVRKEYVPFLEVKSELERFFSESRSDFDFVTLSGSGEPTLNSCLGKVVNLIKELGNFKVALLTNSTLLREVIKEIKEVDVVLPSLDAGREETFLKLNRPAKGVNFEDVISGIKALQDEGFKVWLETVFVKGINDSEEELEKLFKIVEEISPEKWHISTVVRPPAYRVFPLSREELERIKNLSGFPFVEVVAGGSSEKKFKTEKAKSLILELLKRRPCTFSEILKSVDLNPRELEKTVEELKKEGKIFSVFHQGKEFLKAY